MNCMYKPIKGYENYLIGNDGTVYSTNIDKCLKINMNNWNYRYVNLYNNGKSKTFYLHRLVAEYFVPNPKKYKEVNHIDGNKNNNKYDNLIWCSRSQNMKHAYKTGLTKVVQSKTSKKVWQYDKDGNFIKEHESIRAAARSVNTPGVNISNCIKGKRNSIKGYYWAYAGRQVEIRTSKCKRKVKQLDLLGNTIKIYSSLTSAEKETGALRQNIRKCCNGDYKTSGGYKWEYI